MKLFDVKSAAQMLAVSPWTIRLYIRKGRIRPVRIGRLVRLDEQELERFVAEAKATSEATQSQHKEQEQPCPTT